MRANALDGASHYAPDEDTIGLAEELQGTPTMIKPARRPPTATTTTTNTKTVRVELPEPIEFEAFLSKLSPKDRLNVERHIAACEAQVHPDHAKLWQRMATWLATLASHAVQTTGQQAVSFFIADGKYRMQVFALEDARDGKVAIYTPDVLDQAVSAKLIGKPTKGDGESTAHPIKSDEKQHILVEQLTAANTPNPSEFYKHMLGWNRKAMRITLLTTSTDMQMATAEKLCALAAERWLVA
jgi:hypothetical protein